MTMESLTNPTDINAVVELHGHIHGREGLDPNEDFYAEVDATNALITTTFLTAFSLIGSNYTALTAAIAAAAPQVVAASSVMSGTVTGTSYADITNATVTITTTGRPCEIYVEGDTSTAGNEMRVDATGGGSSSSGIIKLVMDGSTDITTQIVGIFAAGHLSWVPFGRWRHTPATGTHTFKLQGLVSSLGCVITPRGRLVVKEFA